MKEKKNRGLEGKSHAFSPKKLSREKRKTEREKVLVTLEKERRRKEERGFRRGASSKGAISETGGEVPNPQPGT